MTVERNVETALLKVREDYAPGILHFLSSRHAFKGPWTSAQAEADLQVPHWQVTKIFQVLDKSGAGRFIIGRRTHPSRFVWNVDSNERARAALGPNASASTTEPVQEAKAPVQEAKAPTQRKWPISLDDGRSGFLELPETFSEKDYADFVTWVNLSRLVLINENKK